MFKDYYSPTVSDEPICMDTEKRYRVSVYGKRVIRYELVSYSEALECYDKYCKTARGRFVELDLIEIKFMQLHSTPTSWYNYQSKSVIKTIFNNSFENASGTPYRDVSNSKKSSKDTPISKRELVL